MKILCSFLICNIKCDNLFDELARIQPNVWGLTFRERFVRYKDLIQTLYGYCTADFVNKRILRLVNEQQNRFLFHRASH